MKALLIDSSDFIGSCADNVARKLVFGEGGEILCEGEVGIMRRVCDNINDFRIQKFLLVSKDYRNSGDGVYVFNAKLMSSDPDTKFCAPFFGDGKTFVTLLGGDYEKSIANQKFKDDYMRSLELHE
jgi:hypothetical protein